MSTRVSKGGGKFVPKAKPRPTRKPTQESVVDEDAVSTPTATTTATTTDRIASGSEQEERESAIRSHSSEEDAAHVQSNALQEQSEQSEQTVPAGPVAIGIPSVGSAWAAAPIAVPAATAASGIPTVMSFGSPRQAPRAVSGTPIAIGGAVAQTGGRASAAPPRLQLHTRQPSTIPIPGFTGVATGSTRLASLSSPISPASRLLRAQGSRVTSPHRRSRTRSNTPEVRPTLKEMTASDYSVLSTDEINNLPISYFCRDTRHGVPTTEHIERENEIIRRINAPPEQATGEAAAGGSGAAPAPAEKTPEPAVKKPAPPANRMAAQVRIVDGRVVVDADSLVINRRDMAETNNEPMEVVDESARTKFINSMTYVQCKTSRKRWKPAETELFYEYLRIHGTDFQMIADQMPNRNRYDIKNKFKAEEKTNSARITAILLKRSDPVVQRTQEQDEPASARASHEEVVGTEPEPELEPEPEPSQTDQLAELSLYTMARLPEAEPVLEPLPEDARTRPARARRSTRASTRASSAPKRRHSDGDSSQPDPSTLISARSPSVAVSKLRSTHR
ncbi:hypothetical protein GGI07_002439 [Coemansia sp. Benny D115]|nr:hypothetical protein GGI07_002439 [Coemansia sp. Benny D115]